MRGAATKRAYRVWPEWEREVIRAHFLAGGWEACASRLPDDRNKEQIKKQAQRLLKDSTGLVSPETVAARQWADAAAREAVRAWYPVARGQLTPALRAQG